MQRILENVIFIYLFISWGWHPNLISFRFMHGSRYLSNVYLDEV